MQDLRISLLQTDLIWENPKENRDRFEQLIRGLEQTDLAVLPEMFTTGFTMHSAQVAEQQPYPSLDWMRNLSKETGIGICGSLVAKDGDDYFNRLYLVLPDGREMKYDKRHLFRMANEEKHYSPGSESAIIDFRGWRIKPLICYDLRFPVWSRNRNDYDLLLYAANWPKARTSAWEALLRARAIENYCYCAGVNRVGFDRNEVAYEGASGIYDMKGVLVNEIARDREAVVHHSLSGKELLEYREKFPVHLDADDFEIT